MYTCSIGCVFECIKLSEAMLAYVCLLPVGVHCSVYGDVVVCL